MVTVVVLAGLAAAAIRGFEPGSDEPASITAPGSSLPAIDGYPDATDTGVPAGTALTPYQGPCTITDADVVIEAMSIDCSLDIEAAGVVIRNSLLNGVIDIEDPGASVTVEDSEIDGGTIYRAAVGYRNITIRRANIHGAQHGVNCADNCVIEDSYIHDQYVPDDDDWHIQPFLSNGASTVRLRHNTLSCTAANNSVGGGCTADISIFGDFSPNSDFLIEDNLLQASESVGYCAYGGTDAGKDYGDQVSGIRFVDNVFERGSSGLCGYAGPVTSFDLEAPGNIWSGNVFDDGSPVNP